MKGKKIAITGHTSGIGKGLYEFYMAQGAVVLGLSRSNGYDLGSNLQDIILESKDCQIFFNNAYVGFTNVELLYGLFEQWKDQDKLIVNLSSDSGDGTKSFVHPYAVTKAALDKACEQLQNVDSRCKVLNIRPGFVETPRVKDYDYPKLKVQDVVDVVDWCIKQPPHIYVRSLSFRIHPRSF